MDIEQQQHINTITQLAPAVAAAHADFTDAQTQERAAEAALLQRVLELVKPALPALCSRMVAKYRLSGIGTASHAESTIYMKTERSLCVGGDDRAVWGGYGHVNAGNIYGRGRLLLQDGTFAILKYDGHWSNWQGAGAEYETTLVPFTLDRVVRKWDVASVIERIAKALEAQHKGRLSQRSEDARGNAERLVALAKLI
jgi:hypothetical protein